MYRRLQKTEPLPPWPERFGIRSGSQAWRDFKRVLSHVPKQDQFTFNLASAAILRPELALPAYAGMYPSDGMAPIFNFFDRYGGGKDFHSTVTRTKVVDWRGGRLSYDEHDGTDFVCPPGTPLVAAAPGVAVATRDTWLRGGLTFCLDHGNGAVTQYTHLSKVVVEIGQYVQRGDVVALSGHSGFDMTQFFPWVAPHLHFMSWIHGTPVDPYLTPAETRTAGTWTRRSDPEPAAPQARSEGKPFTLDDIRVDEKTMDEVLSQCLDPVIKKQMEDARHRATRVALMEDSLHHDRQAWPKHVHDVPLRPQQDASSVRLTLPLSSELYRGARPYDMPWTRPRV